MTDATDSQDGAEGQRASALVYAENLQRRIDRIESERRRVGVGDWKTLFRQIRTVCQQLAETPFISGDLEAEIRLERVLMAPDFDQFDQRVHHLAEYIEGKLEYIAAENAVQTGKPVEEVPRLMSRARLAPGLSRMVSVAGPSGSDFEFATRPDGPDDSQPRPRRGVIRL